jgi:hypothetical protein
MSVHVGFVVDKVALWQVLSESFGFPLSVIFHCYSLKYHLGGLKKRARKDVQFHADME